MTNAAITRRLCRPNAVQRTERRAADAGRDEEHHALAGRVRREELGHVVVEEGQAGGAEAERVGGEVELAADDRRLELRGAVAAVAEPATGRGRGRRAGRS